MVRVSLFFVDFLMHCLMNFVFEFFPGTFEFAHAFAEAPGKFGKFFRSEEKKGDEEDEHHLLSTQGAEECECRCHVFL